MHELSISISLIEEIERILEQHPSRKLASVRLVVGESSGVEQAALEMCFPMAAEGTVAERAELLIETAVTRVRCRTCQCESSPESPFLNCGECQSLNVDVIAGRELIIKSLELE